MDLLVTFVQTLGLTIPATSTCNTARPDDDPAAGGLRAAHDHATRCAILALCSSILPVTLLFLAPVGFVSACPLGRSRGIGSLEESFPPHGELAGERVSASCTFSSTNIMPCSSAIACFALIVRSRNCVLPTAANSAGWVGRWRTGPRRAVPPRIAGPSD